jgi:hypothetical protein
MANKKQYNAEQLDKRLEMMLRSEALLERADEHPDARIRAAARLAKSKPPPLSEAARARIRDRMRQHQPAPAQSTAPPRETSVVRPAASYWQGLAKLAAAVVLVFALGLGSSTATANSLPGDVFYPVKRQIERIELNLAGNAAARADVYLTQANRRLSETDALLKRGEFRTDIFEDAASQLAQAVELAESNRLYTSESGLAAETRNTYDSLTRTLREAPASADITARVMTDLEETVFALSMNTDVIQAPADMQPQTRPDASPEPAVPAEPAAPATSTALPATDLPALDVETPAEVMTAVLTNTPAATATSTAAPVVVTDEPDQVLYVNATGRVNVRSGPGTAYDIIGSVSPGMALNVTGSSDGWQQIEFDGGQGWIASFLLSESEPVITDTDDGGGDNGGDSPGNSDFGCDQPGNACNAPGHSGDSPGNSGNAPGNSGNNPPGHGGNPPGHGGDNPGQGGNPPGRGGDNPGQGGRP